MDRLLTPACFDTDQQFQEWVAADINCYHKSHISLICTDCTPQYAERMRRAGRCEHPEVTFMKFHNAYMGVSRDGRTLTGRRTETKMENWEPVDEPVVTDGPQSAVNA